MKTKKKALLTVLCAAALVFGSVFGTYAYLTDKTDAVTNTFTVGNVAITLDEADTNSAGKLVNADGKTKEEVEDPSAWVAADRVQGNEYHLLPAHTYSKDPTIHVGNKSEDCWLFVKVENGIADIEDTNSTIANQMTTKGWTLIDAQNKIYAYRSIAHANDNISVFDSFKVNENAIGGTKPSDNTAIVGAIYLGDYANATIVVTAYAIQAEGFATAEAAWTGARSAFTA